MSSLEIEFPDGSSVECFSRGSNVRKNADHAWCRYVGPEEGVLPWRHTIRMFGGVQAPGKYAYGVPPASLQPMIDMLASLGVRVIPHQSTAERLETYGHMLERELIALGKRIDRMPGTLRPYQIAGAEYLATHRRACIFDEMGLGKTIQALAAIPDAGRVIVCCPASLRLTWQAEAQKWRPGIFWSVAQDAKSMRVPDASEGIIASPETLVRWAVDGDLSGCTIICDEAHYYKNPKSKRTQAIMRIAEACHASWAMTGTPETRNPLDLMGILKSFGLFERAFATAHYFHVQYGAAFCKYEQKMVWPAEPEHPDLILESLSRVSIRRTRKEVLPEIPVKTYADVIVDITKSKVDIPEATEQHRTLYRAADKNGLALIPPESFECLAAARAALAEAKIPAMLEFVQRFVDDGKALVVGSCNVAPLLALRDAGYPVIFGEVAHEKRQAAVDAFQAGEHPVIGLQTIAGGVGYTLTRAHHMLMVQRDWSPSANAQLEDRICRIGQTESCVIYDLLANHPLDEIISRNLRDKEQRIELTVNKVRHDLLSGSKLLERVQELARYIRAAT